MTKLDYFESERQKELPFLEAAVSRYDMLFIDTSSVMYPGFAKLAANIMPFLKKYDKKIVLCSSVLRELNKLRQRGTDESTLVREVYATMGLYVLERFGSSGLLSKVEDGITEGPADFAFQKLFIGLRPKKRLLLIAQDGNLTSTILRFNLDRSVFAAPIGVKQINFDGFLEPKSHIDAATAEAIKVSAVPHQKVSVSRPAAAPVIKEKPQEVFSGTFSARDARQFKGTELNIPDGYSSVAFLDRDDITFIKLPASVKSIGDQAFRGCTMLKSIVLHDNVVSIGSSAFLQCVALTDIKLPKSVSQIQNAVFRGCSSLTSVELHNGITSIGAGAFKDCLKLRRLFIPASVLEIGRNAFFNCPLLTVACEESSYAHGYCLVNNVKFEVV